ncbi:GNAT family N-acetyltransferase [Shewanella sp. 3B26]|uniref:GNAT family N-acetyltransferase n=1 Tax=Shewanella zhuhaiensis TaxID=2919576 RepID=A0AAJ1BKF5_9GAMM|nr:GNAT family N-acetyltransferase [Shewanella zhuhaiensis]MCH4295409.1 GNAT family N-acetyltransferase [Shewanella zhuhaiensis]
MHREFSLFNEENQPLFDELVSGVRSFNHAHLGTEKAQPLLVCAKDDTGKLLGGIAGRTIYCQFLIEVLWVDDSCRQSGLGRELMAKAEAAARERGCIAAQVDTLAFQAPGFYQKQGFDIIGEVPAIGDSPGRFFLLKRYL